ncbi:MAG TPA: hypothetical protein VLA98_02605 [Solirubrobacteraceae bacterium]|nr:hypothetical protein [Solirubrobacteraceae bacterium]HSD79296.1 hypothetical protein [Solirubrobacteraceae bacterium]
MIAAIDGGLLLELAWVAAAAGVVVAICFSLVILGSVRAGELRRAGRGGFAAAAFGTLGLLASAAIVALLVFGVSVIVSK